MVSSACGRKKALILNLLNTLSHPASRVNSGLFFGFTYKKGESKNTTSLRKAILRQVAFLFLFWKGSQSPVQWKQANDENKLESFHALWWK